MLKRQVLGVEDQTSKLYFAPLSHPKANGKVEAINKINKTMSEDWTGRFASPDPLLIQYIPIKLPTHKKKLPVKTVVPLL